MPDSGRIFDGGAPDDLGRRDDLLGACAWCRSFKPLTMVRLYTERRQVIEYGVCVTCMPDACAHYMGSVIEGDRVTMIGVRRPGGGWT